MSFENLIADVTKDDDDDDELLILASEESKTQDCLIRKQPEFDFTTYRNRPESVASTVISSVGFMADTTNTTDTTNGLWFKRISFMFAGNMPVILTITDDKDKETILHMIENCFSDNSFNKINKLFDENQIRFNALDSKINLSDESFIVLQALIFSFGLSSFEKVYEAIAMRINCHSAIESIYASFKIFVTASQHLLSLKLNRDISEISEMHRKHANLILSLKKFDFDDYFKEMMGLSLCAYAHESVKISQYYYNNRTRKGSDLTGSEYGLYYFILKEVYDQINPKWSKEKKMIFIIMNIIYSGQGDKLFYRMMSHGRHISQEKHESMLFYEQIKKIYPGKQILCVGFKLSGLTCLAELLDHERAVLSFIKALRPHDPTFTNVEIPDTVCVNMQLKSKQEFGFHIFYEFMTNVPDFIRHFIIYKG